MQRGDLDGKECRGFGVGSRQARLRQSRLREGYHQCPAEATVNTWARREGMVRGRKHGDHQVEGAVAAVKGGVPEEQRGEGRLARHQPPLALT